MAARARGFVFVDITPDWIDGREREAIDQLRADGWLESPVKPPRLTLRIDLDVEESKLFAGLDSTARNLIRRASKESVTVGTAETQHDLDDFVSVYQETARRKGFASTGRVVFETLFADIRSGKRKGAILLARHGELGTRWCRSDLRRWPGGVFVWRQLADCYWKLGFQELRVRAPVGGDSLGKSSGLRVLRPGRLQRRSGRYERPIQETIQREHRAIHAVTSKSDSAPSVSTLPMAHAREVTRVETDAREPDVARTVERFSAPETVASYAGRPSLQGGEEFLFSRHLRTELAILDLGVGAGRTTHFLQPTAQCYVGVDISPSMLDAARDRYPHVDFRVADASDLGQFADQVI